MGVIRYKIWRDLWENKGRTMRVVIIIAIGAFAVGAIMGGQEFISQDLTRTWLTSTPASIGLEVKPAVSEDTINTLANLRGVERVEGWYQKAIQWRRGPEMAWEPALLLAIDDYDDQNLRKIFIDSGDWPARRSLGVQRAYGLTVGDAVELKINDGQAEEEHQAALNGVLYSAAQPPAAFIPLPAFYTTRERFEQLTGESNYSLIVAAIPDYSETKAIAAADLLQRELEKQDIEVKPAMPKPGGFMTRTGHPNRFISQDVVDGVFLILNTLAVASVVLGLFLVYNTINAVISQQVGQIGVMKAIGANFEQVLGIYLSAVVVYAGLALLIAAPLGALAAHGLRLLLIGRMNMIPGPFEISSSAVLTQAAVALLSPLLIAIVPIFAGAQLTVREAISSYGLTGATGLLERLLAKAAFMPRLTALTLSNTFRNKQRVLLTEITLVGAGVIFMMVMNTQASLVNTYNDILTTIFRANVMLELKNEARIQEIEAMVLAQPGVETVEVWGIGQGVIRPLNQPEANDDESANLYGLSLPAVTYVPQIRAGRWLVEGDRYAVVLNQELAEQVGVGLGDWVTIDPTGKRESDWQVVGLLFDPLDQQAVYAPRDTLLRELRQVGSGKVIKVQTIADDEAGEAAVAAALRDRFEESGYELKVSREDTSHRMVHERLDRMSILLILLTGMALLIAAVGAVALSGTLSINVMERTREIGVMRAIGASALVIGGQFVGEGLILGWLSWFIALPLSIPVSRLLLTALSGLLNTELVYQQSVAGVLYWFVIVGVLAVLASWLPAQKAAQTSVRESLAYT
ncbi:MAG: ABC transporter permease [Anaerolineales bacterium]|nr:ABC transporter permease [Anaerolineales bacterium]